MFPAHAGMTRRRKFHPDDWYYVPRPRGDDPVWDIAKALDRECSPPTRG